MDIPLAIIYDDIILCESYNSMETLPVAKCEFIEYNNCALCSENDIIKIYFPAMDKSLKYDLSTCNEADEFVREYCGLTTQDDIEKMFTLKNKYNQYICWGQKYDFLSTHYTLVLKDENEENKENDNLKVIFYYVDSDEVLAARLDLFAKFEYHTTNHETNMFLFTGEKNKCYLTNSHNFDDYDTAEYRINILICENFDPSTPCENFDPSTPCENFDPSAPCENFEPSTPCENII
jgi:hypothetical protein